jgi:hypothetical protein
MWLHVLQDAAHNLPPAKQMALPEGPAVDMTIPLQHPAVSTNPRLLCALMQSCKAWQQAAQQCGTSNTAVTLSYNAPLPQLHGFAEWLVKHAPLVRSISAHINVMSTADGALIHGLPWATHITEVYQLRKATLQSATAGCCTATQVQQCQQGQSLHLESYSSNYVYEPGMLTSLPAHSLTHLNFQITCGSVDNEGIISAALAHLTSLRRLQLSCAVDGKVISGSCLDGMTHLTRLASLTLQGIWLDMDQVMQKLLARRLPLRNFAPGAAGPNSGPACSRPFWFLSVRGAVGVSSAGPGNGCTSRA